MSRNKLIMLLAALILTPLLAGCGTPSSDTTTLAAPSNAAVPTPTLVPQLPAQPSFQSITGDQITPTARPVRSPVPTAAPQVIQPAPSVAQPDPASNVPPPVAQPTPAAPADDNGNAKDQQKPNEPQDDKGNDDKGSDDKGNDDKGNDDKGDDKGNDDKGNDDKGNDNKGNDDKGGDDKGGDEKGKDD